MMRKMGFWLNAGFLCLNAGCVCNRPPSNPPPRPLILPAPPAPMMGQPVPVVAPTAAFGQPQPFPTAPSPGFAPPSITPAGPGYAPPPMAPPSNEPPPVRSGTNWQSGENRDAPQRIQLYAPEPLDKNKPPSTAEPPIASRPTVQGPLPPIPQFAEAKPNVYAGLRPPLEGLDWLQANGVQTVVQILLPGESDAAAQKQVEARKMRYVAFEISPETLTKEKADAFIKLVRDGSKQGIFVYDKDSSLAGALWYLNFRWGEILDDDAARIRAASFGLHNTTDGQYLNMWLAVQKLLRENNR